MPGQEVPVPNPPAGPSHLPDHLLSLRAKIDRIALSDGTRKSLQDFRRAACYIAAAMIFLRDNVLLERELKPSDIKPRLLGHWGTCPGIILVWAHLNLLIRDNDLDMIYVIGPGHGAPAALAALWLEGSLERFYPGEYDRNASGLKKLITTFSVSGGFPSHINAQTPGAIHEGGELGYALGVAYGAVMDNPDLVVACLVGDGEAETGPTATSWHAPKFLDPKESGAVIPILHLNGFKISERTMFGCMDDKELLSLFSGYGYQVSIVEDMDNIDEELQTAMQWALREIRTIQKAARSGKPIFKPRWPMIILRTPKGWTGPKEAHGKFIEGSFHSHQVPLPKAKADDEELKLLQDWLSSYKISELLENGQPTASTTDILPRNDKKKLGQIETAWMGYNPLKPVDWKEFAVEKGTQESCMEMTGQFLNKVLQENATTVRLFSPDELESNKLSAVLRHTGRNMQWDPNSNASGGRVIEVLSEHLCQAFLQGYVLTGRSGIFPSYESFLGIIHTMMVQYAKFVKIAHEVEWRRDLASFNYIETSTWARQEHNGFSHQNPSFIGAVLNLKPQAARVYLPPDANCFMHVAHHCLASRNYINLMVGSKQPTPVYLSADEADEHCRLGASIWRFASTPLREGELPDVVVVGIGVEVTFEALKAVELLRKFCPELRIQTVNVVDLMVLDLESKHPHALTKERLEELFPPGRTVVFNYHGYTRDLRGLLGQGTSITRVQMAGYKEEGSTTTPFDMMLWNQTSRFDVARKALSYGFEHNEGLERSVVDQRLRKIDDMMEAVKKHIADHGTDPDDMYEVPVFNF